MQVAKSEEGIRGSLLVPSFGFYDSRLGGKLKKEGIFLGYCAGVELNTPHTALAIETSWSGLGKNFSFSNPLRVSGRWYPAVRYRLSPFVEAGAGLSKIKVKDGESEYRRVAWGGEMGGGLSSAFDRLSFSYSTADGGFRTVELFLGAYIAGPAGRAGTLYRIRWKDKIRTFEIAAYLEGDSNSHLDSQKSRRFLPIRILAEIGLFPLKMVMRGAFRD